MDRLSSRELPDQLLFRRVGWSHPLRDVLARTGGRGGHGFAGARSSGAPMATNGEGEPMTLPGSVDLSGKAAIVTGGGRGLGFACCRQLRRAGADVLMVDISASSLEDAEKRLLEEAGPGRVETVRADVSAPSDLEMMTSRCVDSF